MTGDKAAFTANPERVLPVLPERELEKISHLPISDAIERYQLAGDAIARAQASFVEPVFLVPIALSLARLAAKAAVRTLRASNQGDADD